MATGLLQREIDGKVTGSTNNNSSGAEDKPTDNSSDSSSSGKSGSTRNAKEELCSVSVHRYITVTALKLLQYVTLALSSAGCLFDKLMQWYNTNICQLHHFTAAL